MEFREVDISYGLPVISRFEPDPETRRAEMPFARERILGGCVVTEGIDETGYLFICPKCVEGRKTWMARMEASEKPRN
jgi:hypothetical protein